ncbi:type II toxin-antitoxin system Phd/YefM family antitoxin [Phytopseudomonas dryadis]|uniref:Type II toxin-antitoxin system prevent-host-death family antitoxin n=1 Tax=Phytopseudomonas dryadis TaxID=2487520 RepID=A0A4V6MX99_9GAMM|nr:type II toxin-antitoxin system prevent-host-death family antitoxin [Pseudomonas dryadis]TBU94007.1 type II toxin-antitoxin system prevent-host-death family antitoxin [Pseudomonas dryadis]
MKTEICSPTSTAPKTVDIHDAKAHLSQLILEASQGHSFIIAKAGKPMVKVTAVGQEPKPRLGMLAGVFAVPDDIDTPFQAEIEAMFGA